MQNHKDPIWIYLYGVMDPLWIYLYGHSHDRMLLHSLYDCPSIITSKIYLTRGHEVNGHVFKVKKRKKCSETLCHDLRLYCMSDKM